MRRRLAPLVVATLLTTALALPACSTGSGDGGSTDGVDGTTESGETTRGGTTGSDEATDQESASARELILDRCTRCHDTARIKAAEHDEAGWRSTVERMRSRGAQVNDREASAIVEFLADGGGARL